MNTYHTKIWSKAFASVRYRWPDFWAGLVMILVVIYRIHSFFMIRLDDFVFRGIKIAGHWKANFTLYLETKIRPSIHAQDLGPAVSVCICIWCLSPRRSKSRRPYAALTLDTTACVHRCSAGDWCLGETISSALIQFRPQSYQKLDSFACLADCRGGDGVRAWVAVMAAPWLLLILSLCWPDLSQPAYPTNQPHQVRVGQTFA